MSEFRITKKVLMAEVENFNTTFNVEPKLKLFNTEGSCYSLFQGKSLLFEGNASETHIFLGGFHKGFQKCMNSGNMLVEKSKESVFNEKSAMEYFEDLYTYGNRHLYVEVKRAYTEETIAGSLKYAFQIESYENDNLCNRYGFIRYNCMVYAQKKNSIRQDYCITIPTGTGFVIEKDLTVLQAVRKLIKSVDGILLDKVEKGYLSPSIVYLSDITDEEVRNKIGFDSNNPRQISCKIKIRDKMFNI